MTLPGLKYTHEQLFFLSFARIWASTASYVFSLFLCSTESLTQFLSRFAIPFFRPAQAVAGVRTDPHSPNKFRIEGTLRNFPKFAETWQCKEGSRVSHVSLACLHDSAAPTLTIPSVIQSNR